jgi:hypothetical protein
MSCSGNGAVEGGVEGAINDICFCVCLCTEDVSCMNIKVHGVYLCTVGV